MKNIPLLYLTAMLLTLPVYGCSSTTLTGSWRSPEHTRPVERIYLVGISRHETHRRIFEDEFGLQLQMHGTKAVTSYKDLQDIRDVDQELIVEQARARGADALLMTRILGKRIEEVIHPGHVTGYGPAFPYYGPWGYYPSPYYRNYRDYYHRRYDMIYEPATVTRYRVITLESNLYDTATGALVWSAQLETVMEGSMQAMIRDFIKAVIKDLVEQKVI